MAFDYFATQAGSYAAETTRRAMFSWAARTGANAPGIVAGGVYGAGDLTVSAPASGMGVLISTGEALIGGTEGGSQGGYYFRNSASYSASVAAANATNPRIDAVVATMADGGYTQPSDVGGTTNGPVFAVVTGTPTAGATLSNLGGAPAVPASSLLLAWLLVPAAAANIITADISNVATQVATTPGPGPWQTYTPTWTGSVTNPTIGNGTLTGSYLRWGKTCLISIYLNTGSTTNAGTGILSFGLPFAAAQAIEQEMVCKLFAAANGTNWIGAAFVQATGTVQPLLPTSATACNAAALQNAATGGAAGTGVPLIASNYPLASGSVLSITGAYQTL